MHAVHTASIENALYMSSPGGIEPIRYFDKVHVRVLETYAVYSTRYTIFMANLQHNTTPRSVFGTLS